MTTQNPTQPTPRSNAEHPPTPFSLPLEVHETREGPSIRDSQGERIAEAYTERGAIALTRACNSHAQLVAALRRIADYDAPDARAMISIARAALKE